MSLIKCSRCGKEISDQEKSCPNCGKPLVDYSSRYRTSSKPTSQRNISASFIIRIIAILIFALLAYVGISQRNVPGGENNIEAAIPCLVIAIILFISLFVRKRPHKDDYYSHVNSDALSGNQQIVSISASIVPPEMPQEVLHAIRSNYTKEQTANEIRIIDESLDIMDKTSDIDTFLSRYEVAMRNILNIELAIKAGVKIKFPDNFSETVANAKEKALESVLYRSYKKEVESINNLKTVNGKKNRIDKYQQKLKDLYETEFEFVVDDAYNDIMEKLDLMRKNL